MQNIWQSPIRGVKLGTGLTSLGTLPVIAGVAPTGGGMIWVRVDCDNRPRTPGAECSALRPAHLGDDPAARDPRG
jgi:hypothetical protein